MISFIVPAYNEQALIGQTLDALNRETRSIGEPYEIVVADDSSTDQTARIAQAHGARVIRVNVRQIAGARNAGAREAIGDKLIFVDADTVVTEAVVRSAIEAMNCGAVGGGSAARFDGQVPRWAELLTPLFVRAFRAMGIACGCFLFCTRQAFEATGGFDETLFASEEITMSRALKRLGRFVIVPDSVITSGRKLRMYSCKEMLKPFVSYLRSGRNALKTREGLDLWYADRREDPQFALE
ncbi:MAG TPA: glycosyltransferase [Blastocatellia bacterium]|nr:glycosyltransferase [Blastocatellia bacterium]